MIDIRMTRESVNGHIEYDIAVTGHAVPEVGPQGSEAVCGAVSCMVQSIPAICDEGVYSDIRIKARSGEAYLKIGADAPAVQLDAVMKYFAGMAITLAANHGDLVRETTCFDPVADSLEKE